MVEMTESIKNMIDEGWCFDCNGKLQDCIKEGHCVNFVKEDNDETIS